MRRVVLLVSSLVVAGAIVAVSYRGSAGVQTVTAGQRMTTNARVTLRTYTALVEQHLSSVLTALAAVAASPDAASGKWSRIRPPLSAIARRVQTDAVVWYVRRDGSYMTAGGGAAAGNLSDRSYFPSLMAGHDVEGPLVVSKATGVPSTIVAAPIRTGGKVVGGIGASIDTRKLATAVDEAMSLPSTMVFYAIDASGRFALNRDTSLIFSFPSKLGSPSLRAAVHEMLSMPRGRVSYTFEGKRRTVVFMKSKATGWVFALGKVSP